jgi:ubiquitin carboxyl-terminal hydrolase 5/13
MNTFLGFGKQYVERHFNKTGQRVYLHLRRTRRPVGTVAGVEHPDTVHKELSLSVFPS